MMYLRELPDGLVQDRQGPDVSKEYANPFPWRFASHPSHATFCRAVISRRQDSEHDASDETTRPCDPLVGCLVEVRIQGSVVDLSFHDTVVDLDAFAIRWFATWREPAPVPPIRRGLLYHLVTGFNRWLVEGT